MLEILMVVLTFLSLLLLLAFIRHYFKYRAQLINQIRALRREIAESSQREVLLEVKELKQRVHSLETELSSVSYSTNNQISQLQ